MIIAHALSKINLTLEIKSVNADGYHNLESVFLFLPDVYDVLKIDFSREFSNKSAVIENVSDEDNSVKMAALLLGEHFDMKIPHIEIEKHIPIAAGLGGGSSDAACFVDVVFSAWQLRLDQKISFIKKARTLGADAVVFLYKYFLKKSHVKLNGTGLDCEVEDCDLSDLRGKFVLLVNNGTRLSTKHVFDLARAKKAKSLVEVAIELEPLIEHILSDISSTTPVKFGMSGTGTTCFGIYQTKEKALLAKEKLKSSYPFVGISSINVSCVSG